MFENLTPKLIAILENPQGSGFWLLDQTKSTVEEVNNLDFLPDYLKNHVLVFTDAKRFFEQNKMTPAPGLSVICLGTIKKLLAKDIHDDIKIPSFNDEHEARAWTFEVVSRAFRKIAERAQETLVHLECQVILATLSMQSRGLFFNQAQWQEALNILHQQREELKLKLDSMLPKNDGFALFKESVDLNNSGEVKAALEQLLGRKLVGTSQSSLQGLNHDAVKLLGRYRENAHLHNNYGASFLAKIKSNRLFGNFTPIGSASGRFACHEPNLLALPNHPLFQACLKPFPPRKLLYFDYNAFELRILAALSQDPSLLQIFNDDLDIHSMVAKAVFNTDVSKTMNGHLRDQAKILNFGIIYGMKEHALSKQLGISLTDADQLLHNYFKRFAKVREFLRHLEQNAFKQGYAKTALNRRVYFNVGAKDSRGYHARLARNVPIQGSGADIIKLAFCNVWKKFYTSKIDAGLVNLVHDELVVECNESDSDQVSQIVKCEMEAAFHRVLPNIKAVVSIDR
jgi:DNA polymerase I-like protein with 3'-5' exonuclease and polymerase domains